MGGFALGWGSRLPRLRDGGCAVYPSGGDPVDVASGLGESSRTGSLWSVTATPKHGRWPGTLFGLLTAVLAVSCSGQGAPPPHEKRVGAMDEDLTQHLFERWLHSHEEDTDTESIYRPSRFRFPPSRGRTGFELKPDGSCVYIGIGASDGMAQEACTWALEENDDTIILLKFQSGERHMLRVLSVDSEQLVIRK